MLSCLKFVSNSLLVVLFFEFFASLPFLSPLFPLLVLSQNPSLTLVFTFQLVAYMTRIGWAGKGARGVQAKVQAKVKQVVKDRAS